MIVCDGTEIHFKLKITTKMQKLNDAYCARIGIEDNMSTSISVIFIFNGIRIKGTDTPKSLSMQYEDRIDAMIPGVGWLSFQLLRLVKVICLYSVLRPLLILVWRGT